MLYKLVLLLDSDGDQVFYGAYDPLGNDSMHQNYMWNNGQLWGQAPSRYAFITTASYCFMQYIIVHTCIVLYPVVLTCILLY